MFLPISLNIFGVLKRTVSLRRFFWAPTTYVLVEYKEIIFRYALLTKGLTGVNGIY